MTSATVPVPPVAPDDHTAELIVTDDRRYVFHPWSAQAAVDPPAIAGARGVHFWDHDGRRYLDFASQMVNMNIGHGHPDVVEAIVRQAGEFCMVAPIYATEARSAAARLIVERAPRGMAKVFFTNGGAEAVENAVRMARLHTGRAKVLSTYRSYHGSTATAIQMTGDPRRWPNDGAAPGVVHFFGPYAYRSPFHSRDEAEEGARALEHLRQVIELEGPGTIAAIVLEPVPGTAGVLVPPDGYLAGVRELCDRHGIVFVADEVMAGFGRTGHWFAVDHWGVTPDLITFAKGVNSGYVPLGGVIVGERIAATFDHRPYPGGLTYSGHPLACAAAVAALTAMAAEDIVGNARRIGDEVLGPGLRALADRHPVIGEVRGLGVFWALELVRDRATREPLVPYNAAGRAAEPMTELMAECRRLGVVPMANMNRVHVAPPCTITAAEAEAGLALLDRALSTAGRHYHDNGGRP